VSLRVLARVSQSARGVIGELRLVEAAHGDASRDLHVRGRVSYGRLGDAGDEVEQGLVVMG
jgi:hypothetical protein